VSLLQRQHVTHLTWFGRRPVGPRCSCSWSQQIEYSTWCTHNPFSHITNPNVGSWYFKWWNSYCHFIDFSLVPAGGEPIRWDMIEHV
jgi:hypothetical protein